MNYILKHFNTPLIWFSAETGAEPNIVIQKIREEYKSLLPLDLSKATPVGLESWIRHDWVSPKFCVNLYPAAK